MTGKCPMLGTDCRAWCGYMVDGRCRFLEAPGGVRVAECDPCDPRAWYVETLAAMAADAL